MILPTTRIARAADAPEITRMIEGLAQFHADTAKITVEEMIFLCFGPSPWLTLVVAERGGELLGYAALQKRVQLQFARRLMDVHHLFVAETARGQGVGRALMKAACEHAALNRCTGITLGVTVQNIEAQAFYRRLGFMQHETSGALQLMRPLDLHVPLAAL